MTSTALLQTRLNARHRALGARMVDFAGWDMPVQYQGVLDECRAVRQGCGLFDVSHMTITDFEGSGVAGALQHLLCNSLQNLRPGQAVYSPLLNEQGGMIDDVIVYAPLTDSMHWRMISNASTRAVVRDWLAHQLPESVRILPIEQELIAIQGPQVFEVLSRCWPAERVADIQALPPFQQYRTDDGLMIATTGYTGELGVEVACPSEQAEALWDALVQAGAEPCGLAARDTLRLEAGMNLYGNDMDTSISPLECGLSWTVKNSGEYVGKTALEQLRDQPHTWMKAVVLEGKGVLRHGMAIRNPAEQDGPHGELTSGTFSPVLAKAIGFARVPHAFRELTQLEVQMRGQWFPLTVVKAPFVRHGKALV